MSNDIVISAAVAVASFFIAILIGSTGIGGLLLAPGLNMFVGMPFHVAISICMFAFIFSGLVGSMIFLRGGSIAAADFIALALGAGPAAFAGSFVLARIPAEGVELIIAALCIAAGLHALLDNRRDGIYERRPTPIILFAIGAITGLGSALTGTGGPLILLPILFFLRIDTRRAIGLAQAIQVPIGLLATSANLILDRVEFAVALPHHRCCRYRCWRRPDGTRLPGLDTVAENRRRYAIGSHWCKLHG